MSSTFRFVWDGNVLLHETFKKDNSENTELTTWVFEGFVPTAKLVNGKAYSIISDHLGTPILAVDSEGREVWNRQLDIYGRVKREIKASFLGDDVRPFILFLYQGQYYDFETNLTYNRFRYYSPDSGTYISQDPIGLAGGLAFYGYVMDCNGWIDPWGLSSAALRRNLEASYGDNKQAQHLIPEEVWNDTDNTKFFNDIGLGDGRDKKENGLMIWDNEKMATANNKKYYHGGSHADYSLQVGFEVRDINLRYNIHGDKDLARKEISELQNRLRTELDADLDDINTKAKRLH